MLRKAMLAISHAVTTRTARTARSAVLRTTLRFTLTEPTTVSRLALIKQQPYSPERGCSVANMNSFQVTWDPDYYNNSRNAANTTYMVSLRVDYLNQTSKEYVLLEQSLKMYPAKWGYMPYHFDGSYLKGGRSNNLTFTLYGHTANNSVAIDKKTVSLPVVLTPFPLDTPNKTPVPKGKNLVIALPVVFGSIALLVVGLCIWNRQTRRIQLGNIMNRSRGYTGRQHRRIFNRGRKDNGIQLDAAPLTPPPIDYRDVPDRPRRDSDALGSLTGSPVRGTFEEQGTTGGRNAFRDEVDRQERQRRDDMF